MKTILFFADNKSCTDLAVESTHATDSRNNTPKGNLDRNRTGKRNFFFSLRFFIVCLMAVCLVPVT
jgi:hypothetical protein